MHLSKTAAIRKAREYVSLPHRRSSTEYIIWGPAYLNRLDGPSTEGQDHSYQASIQRRARWVARIALHLMGKLTDEVSMWVSNPIDGRYTIESLVEDGLDVHAQPAMISQED